MSNLQSHRQEWIQALRSGRFTQGYDNLVNFTPNPTHCCIGVGREVAEPGWTESLPNEFSHDSGPDYRFVREYYGYDSNLNSYLICLNDGMYMTKDDEDFYIMWTHRSHLFGDRVKKIVRNTDEKRDQKFIARFLEIVWKTNTPIAESVSST